MADFPPATDQQVRELVVRLPSADDAARVGLIKALRNTKSDSNEWGGIIFQAADGRYYAVDPVTSKDRYEVKMHGAPYDRGDQFAATYHTHPSNDDSARYHSGGDVQTANTVKKPSYVGVESEDAIRLFTPGGRTIRATSGGRRTEVALGKMVLQKLLAGVTTPEERTKIFQAEALKVAQK